VPLQDLKLLSVEILLLLQGRAEINLQEESEINIKIASIFLINLTHPFISGLTGGDLYNFWPIMARFAHMYFVNGIGKTSCKTLLELAHFLQ
jgi:hypothetical protein